MDILPIEVVFNQTLFFVINLYLKLSNFIINYQSSLKTNILMSHLLTFIPPLRFSQGYVAYLRHNDDAMQHNN